ncbi:Hypothetical protein NocV09_07600070 [Nannochloropsis oceanica]
MDHQLSSSMWGEFQPFSGSFLMKGYHPLAGGLLDDSSPLTWTKVLVYLKEPNVLVICQSNIDREEELIQNETDAGGASQRTLPDRSRDDLTIRIDRHTSVTGVTKKNYSTDPSKSIVLEAFVLEKAKDWGVLLDGLKYKRLKFAVLPSQRQKLVDLRTAIIGLCDKAREVPEEVSNGGLLHGIRARLEGGRPTYTTMK